MRTTAITAIFLAILCGGAWAALSNAPAKTAPAQIESPKTTAPVVVIVNVPESSGAEQVDRAIGIMQVTATFIEILVGFIAIILGIAGAFGYFEYRRWRKFGDELSKKVTEAEKTLSDIKLSAHEAKTVCNNVLDDAVKVKEKRDEIDKLGEEVKNISLSAKPSEDDKNKIEELARKINELEILGLSLRPEDYRLKGNDYYFKGAFDNALKSYEKAIELKPDYAEAWSCKGVALEQLERLDEALKVFDVAIRLKPDLAAAWSNKGVALGELGRLDEALKVFDEAIRLKPDYADAWYNKGVALGTLGRLDETLKAFDEAIRLKPDDVKAWYYKACTCSMLGKKKDALETLRKAIELDAKKKDEAKTDEDFKSLRDDPEFRKLVGLE